MGSNQVARSACTPSGDEYRRLRFANFFFSITSHRGSRPSTRSAFEPGTAHASCPFPRGADLSRARSRIHARCDRSADSVSLVGDGFGAVRRGWAEVQHPAPLGSMRGINGAPDLPLGGSSFHHPLAFSCRRVHTPSWPPLSTTRPGAAC